MLQTLGLCLPSLSERSFSGLHREVPLGAVCVSDKIVMEPPHAPTDYQLFALFAIRRYRPIREVRYIRF
jgi:hypothetical protein